jgi:hypothetical protein
VKRCPSCQNLVPAGQSACHRCGSALPVGRSSGGVATRARSTGTHTVVQFAPVRDTLLPGGGAVAPVAPVGRVERDSMLPGARRARPLAQRRVDRRFVLAGAGVLAVLVGAWTFWPSPGPSKKERAAAEALTRRVTDVAHAFYAKDKNYGRVTEAAIVDRLDDVHAVTSGRGAEPGAVSLWIDAHTVTVATALGADRCLFARTDPKTSVVEYATGGLPCAASTAPRKGWST